VSSGGSCVGLRRLERCFNILRATSTSRIADSAGEALKIGSSVALISSWVEIGGVERLGRPPLLLELRPRANFTKTEAIKPTDINLYSR
jgi:hypothetical protein